ncbi:hypothetical protein PSACC_01532 [Paramicrosporidium saccamoebae]|uniref:Major facilitator superfamily associated domain-containing protein n=1 Tax=Paramicrosporidium saccamoebae TaxID=1246581 RepID=A0A2H9TLQ2_9FUNG|nr:hypothetical protein PSACC_01532 [Paramicrosporidium saccamoebae]
MHLRKTHQWEPLEQNQRVRGHKQMSFQGALTLNNRFLLTPKYICFAVGALNYAFDVYRMKLLTQHFGFEEDLCCYVMGVMNMASFVGVTLWSSLADRLGIHRIMLVGICLAMSAVFELGLLTAYLDKQYWHYLAFTTCGLYGLLLGGLMPLTDDQILKLLTRRFGKDKSQYGRQAMMGMLVYGIITKTASYLFDIYKVGVFFVIVPVAGLLASTSVLMFGYHTTPTEERMEKTIENEELLVSSEKTMGEEELVVLSEKTMGDEKLLALSETSSTSFSSYVTTIARPRFILCLLVVMATGFGRQTLKFYLPQFLNKELLLSENQIGNAYLGSSCFSILFYFCAPISFRYLGVRPMLLIGQLAMIMRISIYAFFTPHPHLVPFVELLNGMGYSFTHLAAVQEATECAPPGWEATFQAVYGCIFVQLPAMVCPIVGGYLVKWCERKTLLRIALAFPVVSSVLLSCYLVFQMFQSSRRLSK